jgi:hypothetical protein
MDDLDHLAIREELAGPARIAASRKPVGPVATGKCLWCEVSLEKLIRYCSSECQIDWNKQQRATAQRWPK